MKKELISETRNILKTRNLSSSEVESALKVLRIIYIGQNIRKGEGILCDDHHSRINKEFKEEADILLEENLINQDSWYSHEFFHTTDYGSRVGKALIQNILNKGSPIDYFLGKIPSNVLRFIIFDYIPTSLHFPVDKKIYSGDWREVYLNEPKVRSLVKKFFEKLLKEKLCVKTKQYVSTRGGKLRGDHYVISPEIQKTLQRGWNGKRGLIGKEKEKAEVFHFFREIENILDEDNVDDVRNRYFDKLQELNVSEEKIGEIVNNMREKDITTNYRGLMTEKKPFEIKNSSKYRIYTKKHLLNPALKQLLRESDRKRDKENGVPVKMEARAPNKLVGEIVNKRATLNMIFNKKYGIKLLKERERAPIDLSKECTSRKDFIHNIQVITTLIDDMSVKGLKEITKEEIKNPKSINMLEKFLKREYSSRKEETKSLIQVLRDIVTLRNKIYPIHTDDPRFIKTLNNFGFKEYPPDWEKLWNAILRKYSQSLENLKNIVRDLND